MNNKDLLRLASLNETLDKEQIRKNAIQKANKVVVLRRAVATAACTLLMAGICLSVALLNPPKTEVSQVEQTEAESTAESTKGTKPSVAAKGTKPNKPQKTHNTTRKTNKTQNILNTNPDDTDNTDNTDEHLFMESETRTLPSTHALHQGHTTGFVPEDNQITQEITYTEYDTYIAITGYEGTGDTVVLPNEINGKPVTTILESFNKKNNIKYVWIPSSVTHIDPATFIIGSNVVIQAPIDSYAYKYAKSGSMYGVFLK